MSEQEQEPESSPLEGIAVVGLAGRFPGADDLAQLWRNLCGGVEAITFYSREELEAAGVPAELLDDPRYVRAGAALRDVRGFDAAFFGFSAREAELMDPQHRLFLECSWEALENAGYDTESYPGSIGVFAGMGMSSYLIQNLLSHRGLIQSAGALQVRILNDNNYLTALAAYKLDLRGPSVTVQSACSTSLVATCMACQSLLQFQCDLALAGGVTVVLPHAQGYLAQESVMSPDGHCRAFDAGARGTVEGSGAGVVVLKRLSDAVAEGDTIHAVIRGFATNNDGGFKMSFTAPSLDGQVEVIAMAQAMAGVPAESITYVEAHGTGTPLGDPVEVAALSEVFAAAGEGQHCALGSIKTNIGHLDAAAGVAGLIKAVLAVEHGVLPPSLHFETPNPRIDFARSPFRVNTECRPWRPEGWPRRAGVSAFAIGGMNAHVILEEPPAAAEPVAPALPVHLLTLSARTETALEAATDRLLAHLRETPSRESADLADIAYTLQVGRRAFRHRRVLACRDLEDAAGILERRDPRRLLTGTAAAGEPQVAFLFPGLGTQYAGMARGLYRDDAGFRARIDDCAERLAPLLGLDLREVLFPEGEEEATGKPGIDPGLDLRALLGRAPRSGDAEDADLRLRRTALSQPAVFAVEYALASRLIDWGIRPQAMLGFSIGEYVAACLAGVLSLDDALRLVAGRALLIDELPPGAMLAVPLGEAAVAPWLAGGLSLAAVAGPDLTVLAGTEPAVAAAEERLIAAGHVCRRLQTSHAFHSTLMEPVVERFLALFAGIELHPPEIPYLSNVTGDWITGEQATDPAYWAEHLLGTVRFGDALGALWSEPGRVLLEVGPGQTLGSWALQHPAAAGVTHPVALPTLRHAFERTDDLAFLLQSVGRLWLTGLRLDAPALWAEQPRRRVPLPTYPFERRPYWIEPFAETAAPPVAVQVPGPSEAAAPAGAAPRQHPRPRLHNPYAPPRDAAERRLVEILGELLHLDEVGIHDSFFDLGGDSLLATHLVALLNRELGTALTLRTIFESPTAAELAAVVAGARREAEAGPWGPVARREAGGAPPPLSFAQRRLWFLNQLLPGDPAYNVPAAVLLAGRLDPAVLADCVEVVVARHEALRTTFGPSGAGEDEEPVQHIAPPFRIAVPGVDLEGLPAGPREDEALRLAVEEALCPFDLVRGPLLRAVLLRLDAGRHVALFTLHHMVGDGWSSSLLVREVATLYGAFAAGAPSPLPDLPVQYADFVLWQRENLRGAEMESQLAFWRAALTGAPPALDLPADRPHPAQASGRGGLAVAPLAAAAVERLKEVGRHAGATPFMTLLAAFYALLYRSTGEADLVVGTPIANRRRPELEGLIGFFANTLALRAAISGRDGDEEPTFAGLLAVVREAALSAYAHQDLPFERLVEELAPRRSLARSPVFQVLFLWHGTPAPDLELPGLTISSFGDLTVVRRTAKFDLTLELMEGEEGLNALLEFRRDLFDPATAARLLGHFAILVAALSRTPEGRIAELPLLGEGERHQLTVEWSTGPGGGEGGGDEGLHQAFEAQAAARPGAPALVAAGETLTYGELDARAGRLARHLRSLGVGPEVPVAVCAERSADLVVALLAVLKAGGAYLPLDPGYPRERLSFLLEDAAAPVLVAPSRLADLLPDGARRVPLDAPEAWSGEGERDGDLPRRALPGQLAYLIYTSGSTGRPKGVAIPHGAAVALVRWAVEVFPPADLDGVLASTSICFDLSVFELFVPLSLGGRVILAENALELPRLAAASEVRLINTVPSAMGELVRQGAIPPSVRTVGLAGEPLRRDLVERIYAAAPGVERVLNLYGPSETTTYSTWTAVERGAAGEPAIGQPIAGTRAHVLDGALAPVPIGVPGELFLGGAGLARGYLGRPGLTAEKWLPDPFGAAPGGRLYRTGDRVRLRPDGRLELLGRADAQVKIRGFRIEPGEIEAALTAHPAVAQAAVVAQDEGGDRRLVAWVVAQPGADLTAATLRTALERLPAFMIPAVFAIVEDLPRNANGKVDRGALARRPVEAPPSVEGEDAPRSPLEEGVAAIFAEVLGRERVGRGESFFDLGGHSLLATRVVSRLRAAFGVELPVRCLFEVPTPAGLAAEVAAAVHGAAPPPLVPLPASAREGGLPLSFAQQRLWLIDQLEPGSPVYNIPLKVELRGRLDPGVLAAALGEVVRRHEALRTRFAPGPVQVIEAAAPVALAVVDLGALPRPESRREEARLTGEEALRPFDLARGPLLRTLLLRRGEGDQVLALSMHHIVSDGWSMGVLIQEVGALYAAFVEGRPSPLPALAIQYADFAVWQRLYLSGARLEAELAWWRGQLAGMPPALELPADRPRPAVASGRGEVRGFAVDRETSAALARLSRQQGATLFMTLAAAFAALLGRVAGDGGEDGLAVGTPIAGRTRVETEPLIGFFVNLLVLRMDLAGDPDLVTLLARVRETALGAYAHQELPFERLVEELAPERRRGLPPLVQVMFALQNAVAGPAERGAAQRLPGLDLSAVALPSGTAKLDLTVALRETGEGLAGEIEYNRDLFDAATIERLAGRFVRLLAGAVADPLGRLSELPLLSPAEHQETLVEWNATATAYPRESSLPELFAEIALAMPDAPAIVVPAREEKPAEVWTYGRLAAAASRLARRLRSLGVGPQTPVGLALERSAELIVGMLAILEAGGFYVPLDPGYPDERLAFMLADVGAGVVLVEAGTRERLAGRAHLVAVGEDAGETADGGPPGVRLPAQSAAYVIYTSGSTGRPKGVAVPHRAVVRLVRESSYASLGPGDRVGMVANISFDAATWEIWGALLNGAAVVVIAREVVLSPAALAALLREQRVTSLFLTTALFTRMAHEVPDAFAGLRDLLFGGETADPAAARAVLAAGPPRRLLHVYGPTESTAYASWHLLREVPPGAASLPIGAPLSNTSLYVLDRRLAPAPPGTAGELCIGGDGLAWGYWNRPELTAERFVPDPWGCGGRLYRTGDLVRRPAGGALEFLGRLDQQVKIRGFRIEPGEIEAALLALGPVRSAAVLPRRDAAGALGLVACVVVEEDGPGAAGLRQRLAERLPAFMLPSAFVVLPALPLTANGKVDRKALAALRLEQEGPAPGAGAAPRTPTEELVAGIFAEVLRVERVGVSEDFFALGGHSLLATQVASRVRSVFGRELPLRSVFERPTVEGLAAEIVGLRAESGAAKIPPPVRVSRDEPLALSFAQQRLWFLDQLEPGSPLYNIPLKVELRGRLDPGVLAAVLGEVVRRHEVLRTHFAAGPVQVIEPAAPLPLPLVDLSGLPRERGLREEARRTGEEVLRPFDLARGPLLRALLLRRGEDDWVLALSMHHVVSDGWSMGVLVREVGALYAAFREGRPSPLPELAIQYADFAAWQRRTLAGERLEAEIAWWRDRLAGMPQALDLPADRPRPAVVSERGGAHSFAVGGETLAALNHLSRESGATLFMTLLAGFAALLGRVAGEGGEDDLGVGTPVAGRTRVETEPLIGFFVNTLVLRVRLAGDPDFGTLLGRVRETTLSAYAHQELPFERLVEAMAPERDRSRAPLVQVMLALQNAAAGLLEMPGLELEAVALPGGTAKLDLMIALQETPQGLHGDVEYSRDLFDGATVERLAGWLVRLLAGAAAHPGWSLSELPLLSPQERAQLLVEWSDSGALPPPDLTLHALFEAQAARTPEAAAVVLGTTGESWTYRELDLRAEALARRLAGLGVGPEARVGVCLDRTPLVAAALLAVLKAGGAYVPLDPTYPRERLAFLLEDAGVAVLLTRRDLAGCYGPFAGVVLEADRTDPSDPTDLSDRPLPTPGNLAYLIYTSGSTGRPKGVAIEHRSAVAFARWARTVFPPEDLAGVLAATSVSFDLSVFELFVTLAWGGTVILADNALELPRLTGSGVASEVTLINTVPSAMAELVRQGALPASVRTVNLAGEPLKLALVEAIHAASAACRVLDLYGPSEATTYSTWALAPRGEGREPVIGRPIAGTRAVLLGRSGEPVPVGVVGELLLGGEGLARGYLNRPDLTAERFVPDPFAPAEGGTPGGRLYRTGDLARRLPDGRLDYRGRIDTQVKVRGFRIEPGEIEAALLAHPGVREAAALVREDRGGGGLTAYVVAAPGEAPGQSELRDLLGARLPGFMVPAAWMFLPALPLTANGKVDRKALAQLGPGRPAESPEGAARTPAEELLAGIFAEVLGVERVGNDESFFALGGHSLLATQVASRVRSVFGVELPVRSIFDVPTVEGLAAVIAGARLEGHHAGTLPPARAARTEPIPLSFGQERLWFLQQLEPGSATYNMPLEMELSGALHAGALAAALTGVVSRHESLRTTFEADAGTPRQRISPPPAGFPLPLVDLSALPAAAGVSAAEHLAREQADLGLDLLRGPLFVALLLRLSAGRHRFLLNLHHIVSDGWSLQVLVRELGALYAAALEGRPSPLPVLPLQYADFAQWQRGWLAEKQEEELAYWESRLGGDLASAELPTDRPRPAVQTFRGGRRELALSPDLTARLRSFGRGEGVTLFMTLLAATQVLLSRHSGERDVAVGAPVAGRRWSETEDLIGFFLNTLVLRTDLSGRPGFREVAARVRTVTLEAYSHQDVPFEVILNRLRLERDLSRSPLFQVLFNLLNLPARELSLPELELRLLTPAEVPSKFDMTFYVFEAGPQVLINLVYNADLFDEAHMDEVLAQLTALLEQGVERPDEPVFRASLVTGKARAVLPDPAALLDGSWIGSVYELFAARAGRAPDRPAVAGAAGVWSYGELLAGSRRVAGWLAAQRVRPGEPVAILAVRAAPLVEAMLGVLGAGAAFVMLDSAYPALRQLEMLRLAAPRAWISIGSPGGEEAIPAEVRSWLREAACPCLEIPPGGTGAVAELAAFAWEAPQVRVGPEDLACIGFTSGSTGGPKGVLGRHGSLSHFLPTHCRMFDLGAEDRFSLLSGLGHDPLQREIFTPLYLGATIAVPDPADYGITGRLAAWMHREQVTVAHLTPTLGQLLTELPFGGTREPVPSLRRVLLVGESLTRKDVERLRALAPGVSCINLYGSTETQRAVGFHRVRPEEAEAALTDRTGRAQQVLPLGRGVPDVQLLVLNPEGGLAGLGELGEIAVRSPHLAGGYLGNAELTAERFQVNPFTPFPGNPGDRIYRTGDLGRYRTDGEVVFAGRVDQQVKLRGFRIEPGEIEGVLVGMPGVQEAVVLLRTDLPGGAGLVAYVRTEEGRESSLRGELEARLPAYMVPAAFVRLDKLPRNANGKVDRRALSRIAPELGAAVRTLPRTPAEELLAGIWTQVLGIEQIGVEQSFFELGGHSLLATQMASRVRDVFGVDLPLRSLFVTPALEGLAAEIERLRSGGPEPRTIASFRQDRGAPPPLSLAQERYWAGRHLEARSVASTLPMLMHLVGPLDRGCLRRALAAMVDRHELLRTSFREGPEGPIQVIHPSVPVALPGVDLSRLGAPERMEEVRRFSVLDGRLHFDYERPPLFRSTLFRCADDEHVLLFTIHHVASDWWSGAVLRREVAVLYLAFRDGHPSPLPPLPAQFQDFARWQRRLSPEEAEASQVTFWREHLSGAVPVDLAAGRRLPPGRRTYTAGVEEILVPEELEKQLEAFSARQGVTLFMTLLAAFQVLLSAETGQDDLVVPCSFANRNQLETESLIGNLATGLPLRTRLSGARTFRELLQQVRDVTLLAHEHPDIFWEPVVEGMRFLEEGDRGGLITFRILFQLVKTPPAAPAPDDSGSDLRITQIPVDTGRIRLDLSLFLSQAGRLAGRFRYNRDVLDRERVAGLRDRFLRILAAVVADPEHPLDGLARAEPVPAVCLPL